MAEEECISPFNEGRRKFVKPKLDHRRELVNIAQEVSKVMQAQDNTLKTGAAAVSIPFLNSWGAAKRKKQTSEYEMKLNALDRRMQQLESQLHSTPPEDQTKKLGQPPKGKIPSAATRYRKSVYPGKPGVPKLAEISSVPTRPSIPQPPALPAAAHPPQVEKIAEKPDRDEEEGADSESPPEAKVQEAKVQDAKVQEDKAQEAKREASLFPSFGDPDEADADDDEDSDDEDDSDS